MNMVASQIDAKTIASGGRPLGLFAINLDRSADRWATIEAAFGRLPWPLQRVAGIDARKTPSEVLAVRNIAMRFPPEAMGWNAHRNRLFMVTEEACLVGHILAWRQFLASDFEHAIVLEDDAVPQPGFDAVVRTLLSHSGDAQIVKLEGIYKPGARKALTVRAIAGHQLVRSLRPCSGSAAYLITRHAAQTLIERVGKTLVPMDDFLWSPMRHGLKLADVSPWIVMQSGEASVIATTREAKTAKVAAPFGRSVLMTLRRLRERLGLLWSACDGRPHKLLNPTMAPWVPDDYNLGNRTAVAAEDQRSSNG